MRIKPLLVTITAVSALLTTLTACGSDDSSSDAAGFGQLLEGGDSGGKKGTGFKSLAKAGSMAEAARLINGFTRCDNVGSEPYSEYSDSSSDSHPDKKYDEKTFSVTERGYCGRRGATSIFMIKDAKKFQAAYKAEVDRGEGGGNVNSGPVVGQDFAAGSQSEEAMAAMLTPQSGMLMLNCHAEFNPPSGFRKEPALVKGCVLTDYYKD
ncbi:hypothetical protein [Streptomyces sp. NPDC002054]|uniref:hypothetical protein n=1 Tax=Streptomyces sp. NPDC002054 TaxID=3154663 RepID=UPI0033265F62